MNPQLKDKRATAHVSSAPLFPGLPEEVLQVMKVIPECGHWATEEQPVWVADRVLKFLALHG